MHRPSGQRTKKKIPQLTERLIEILKIYRGKTVPDDARTIMPEQKQQPMVGTLTYKAQELHRSRQEKRAGLNVASREE